VVAADAGRLVVGFVAKPGSAATGLGRYAAELERGLPAKGVEVRRLEARTPLPGALNRAATRLGFDLETFGRAYPLRVDAGARDVTHLASQTLATLLLTQRLPRPVVVTVHDILPYLLRDDPALRVYRHRLDRAMDALAMRGLGRADRLIAVSLYTKRTVVETLGLPAERIDVVHNGVDAERFRPLPVPAAFRDRYGLAGDGPSVLFVGSEDPRKDLPALLRAVAALRRGGVGARLLKVGAPAFAEQRTRHLRLCDELGIADAVRWIDAVPEADLPLFYNAADLFALPSRSEGFGLPVLEALACGTATVANRSSSLPELVGDAATLVDAADPEAFAGAMAAALAEGEAAVGRRVAQAARFSWAATAAGVAASYRRAIAAGGTKPGRDQGRGAL